MDHPPVTSKKAAGSLVVIGTGIRVMGQLTVEAIKWMERADALLYIVADPGAAQLVTSLNPAAVSLSAYYKEGEPRDVAYEAMVDHVLDCVRSGKLTVFAGYGHPAVCAYAPLEAIRRARAEGFSAMMLPAVSSLDCLFADLGVDPAQGGCQMYEAADFFERIVLPDVSSHLVIWQIAAFGDWNHRRAYDVRLLPRLIEKLCTIYPASHEVTLYEASPVLGNSPVIQQVALASIETVPLNSATTLYIPPLTRRRLDPRWQGLLPV